MWLTLTKRISDEDYINGIRQGYPRRQIWENKLYMAFRYMIKDATWKHNLQEDEASIAYSDAILVTIKHIDSDLFEQRSSLKTYIYKIFQFKCIDLIRTNKSNKQSYNETLDKYLELVPDEQQDTLRQLSAKYEVDILKRRIQLLDDRCKHIILAWGEGYLDKEIAEDLGYNSPAVAKTSRLRCLEKLKKSYKMGKETRVDHEGGN